MDILIDQMEGNLWVAALKKGKLEGLEIDPVDEEVRYGSLYRGRVIDIDKAMDAAFIDLDGDNTGLLHNADIWIQDKKGNYKKGGAEAIGKTLKPGDYVTVQAKGGYMPRSDSTDMTMKDKSVRVSMNITIPGRHLIFSPMMKGNRISKRIYNKKQRKQLTKMLSHVEDIQGCILRSSAANVQTDILSREGQILKEIWNRLQEFIHNDEIGLIMLGPDAIARILSDHSVASIDKIDVAAYEYLEEVGEWCEIYAPDLVTKISETEDLPTNVTLPLFDYRDVLDQVEELLQPYIILKNGGNIIIQETAALIAIDVNRGGDTRSNLAINLEAVGEVGEQLRMRNLSGIIIIDCLKMTKKADRQKLTEALNAIATEDPCTVQVHGFTSLGLAELTRQRRSPTLRDRLDLLFE